MHLVKERVSKLHRNENAFDMHIVSFAVTTAPAAAAAERRRTNDEQKKSFMSETKHRGARYTKSLTGKMRGLSGGVFHKKFTVAGLNLKP